MIFASLRTGFRQMWANKRLVLIFFLANFAFGLLLTLPLRSALDRFIGGSLMGAELGGRFNFDFLFEFMKNNPGLMEAYPILLLVTFATYWLVTLFLSGGAFAVFAHEEGYASTRFWGGAGRYFGRFFRLALWSLPLLALFVGASFIVKLFQRLLFGSDPYEYVTYWANWIVVALRTLAILLFGLVFDYARIYLVLTDETRSRAALWRGLGLVFRNLLPTFGLGFLFFFLGVVALVLYNPLADALAAPNALVLLLLFLLQQGYMLWRMMLRLALYAGELSLYRSLAEAATVPAAPAADLGLEGTPA